MLSALLAAVPIDERHENAKARVHGAVISTESLDDARPCLRHDADHLAEDDKHEERDDDERDDS